MPRRRCLKPGKTTALPSHPATENPSKTTNMADTANQPVVSQLGSDLALKLSFAAAVAVLPFLALRLYNWIIYATTASKYPLVNPKWDEPTKKKFTHSIRDLLTEGATMVRIP